ncbi:hypothetical protein HNP84_008216 [Thermocatellispora tengchongensis]|uniref:CBM2 domain-containing protein n=1 Tax=Thermocatellispora tengchongensis TaxID=1073253 RepID=A0A840PH52_9ACTN|nr:cellulose binding domain-containing protein [Thermocatellispora tengchongensis]MBB5138462.1 hypothetical protein [Thermocatellispora tengchongensis]
MRRSSAGFAVAALVAGALATAAAAAPAHALTEAVSGTASCSATYMLIGGGGGFTAQAQVTVRNTGTEQIKGWGVAWIYRDAQRVTYYYNAVPLPTIAVVGAYAFGNTTYNGALAPGQTVTFGLGVQAANGIPTVPSPVNCSPNP